MTYEFGIEYTCLYMCCTLYIRVWTWSVHSMYMLQPCPSFLRRWECKPLLCSKHFPDIHCTYSPQQATYNASAQESAIWYRHCWAAYMPSKNACGRWSAFLCNFLKIALKHVCQRMNMVEPYLNHAEWCLYAKMTKCHRKADHLPQAFLEGIYTAQQCLYQMADSCTLALYVACWGEYVQCISEKCFEQARACILNA